MIFTNTIIELRNLAPNGSYATFRPTAKQGGVKIEDEDLRHVLPTMVEHINFVGRFDVNLERMPPFKLVEAGK